MLSKLHVVQNPLCYLPQIIKWNLGTSRHKSMLNRLKFKCFQWFDYSERESDCIEDIKNNIQCKTGLVRTNEAQNNPPTNVKSFVFQLPWHQQLENGHIYLAGPIEIWLAEHANWSIKLESCEERAVEDKFLTGECNSMEKLPSTVCWIYIFSLFSISSKLFCINNRFELEILLNA